jgi:uncharacterized membrane protein (DUF485 family)
MRINHREVLRRLVKYFILTLLVAYSAKMIIKTKVSNIESFYIGVVAATIFAVLDMISPTIYIKTK